MTNITIVPATMAHAIDCAENMREQDKAEVRAAYNHSPIEALTRGARLGAHAALADDRVICIFGIINRCAVTRVGVPWMLTTNLVNNHRKVFAVKSKELIQYWGTHYDYMFNYVDARYVEAVNWLRWSGFTIHPAAPYGAYKLPFHKFDMVKN